MPELQSTISCPLCGGKAVETMPVDACQYFYDCRHCGEVLRPLKGDCCVFCSYGDVACPPVQEALNSGSEATCCVADKRLGPSSL